MLTVPKGYVKALERLASLSDASITDITARLSRLRPIADARDAIAEVAKSIKEEDGARDIVNLLISLHAVREHSDQTVTEFVTDLSLAIERSGHKDLKFPDDEVKKRLSTRLSTLLGIEAFAVTAKAIDLRYEYEHTFCRARILTDSRPVYGNDPAKKPTVALITHTLKLSYHHASELKHFYVTMTEAEINVVKKLLERADKKAKSLRQALGEAHISIVAPHEEEE